MKRIKIEELPPFASINDFAFAIGLGKDHIRTLCKTGSIPGLKVGNRFYIDVEAALSMLRAEGRKSHDC